MTVFNVIAGIASLCSLLFAFYVYHRCRISEEKERGKMSVLSERLANVADSIRIATTTNQQLIRRADDSAAPNEELQGYARNVRTALYGAMVQAKTIRGALRDWRFGKLMVISDLEEPPSEAEEPEPPDKAE